MEGEGSPIGLHLLRGAIAGKRRAAAGGPPLLSSPSPMAKKTTIEVHTDEGPRPVEAEVDRGWAVHPSLDGRGWTVTHVRTGRRLIVEFPSQEQAQRVSRVAARDAPGDLSLKDAVEKLTLAGWREHETRLADAAARPAAERRDALDSVIADMERKRRPKKKASKKKRAKKVAKKAPKKRAAKRKPKTSKKAAARREKKKNTGSLRGRAASLKRSLIGE